MSVLSVVQVMVSTNPHIRDMMLRGEFNTLVWASDNLETVAHYYEGAVVELTVRLDKSLEMDYVRDEYELTVPIDDYGFGVAEMRCPKDALWYSFSRNYLLTHVVGVCEVFPDLTPWYD